VGQKSVNVFKSLYNLQHLPMCIDGNAGKMTGSKKQQKAEDVYIQLVSVVSGAVETQVMPIAGGNMQKSARFDSYGLLNI